MEWYVVWCLLKSRIGDGMVLLLAFWNGKVRSGYNVDVVIAVDKRRMLVLTY